MDKIEIDGETADRIVVCSLKESINYARKDIAKYKKRKNKLNDWEKQELADLVIHLTHLEAVFEYYGGHFQ
jgi:hypothetical protein